MVQTQFFRLNPLGLGLGCAAAALVAVILRALTFGFGFGMWGRGPYMHRPYGPAGMGMMQDGFAGFAVLAAIGFIVFCGILGAVVAVTYNAVAARQH